MLNNQEIKMPVLIEDLGMEYPTKTSNQKFRYGLYRCFCGNKFRTQVRCVKRQTTKSCGCILRQNSTIADNNKKCSNCKEIKSTELFAIDKRAKTKLSSWCKECIKLYKKSYREKNKKKISIYSKKYSKQNRSKILQYRRTKKGKISSINSQHKRRTELKQGDVTTNQLLELQQNAKVCYWCECSLKNNQTHIDHYIPLSKGGLHTISNLVVTCSKCNLKKHNSDPLKYAVTIGKLL